MLRLNTACLITEIYQDKSCSFHDFDSCMYNHSSTVLAPVFVHQVSSRKRIVHVKISKSLEKLRWRLLVCED